MKYFSMFTGVGGFELGIQQAYENNKEPKNLQQLSELIHYEANLSDEVEQRGREQTEDQLETFVSDTISKPIFRQPPTCVGFSEIDKYASQLLSIKWPNTKNYGDATTINEHTLPDFDLLVGGFPCQSFSIAGKRKGFDDTRGTLFFDIARILAHKKPSCLVLENVKGLLSHNGGRTFQTIIRVLTDLGYFIEWQVLNSKNFGVPQNRERVFIVGHLGEEPRSKVFPIRGENETYIEKSPTIIGSSQRHAKVSKDGIIPTLSQAMGQGGGQTPMIVHNIYGGFMETEVRTFKDISPTIRTPKGGGHLPMLKEGTQIRRLTPLECERLQSFPDGWTEGFSDTQRYKMMGNAVTVNVVEYIIEKMITSKFL